MCVCVYAYISVSLYPEKRNPFSFVNISHTVVNEGALEKYKKDKWKGGKEERVENTR